MRFFRRLMTLCGSLIVLAAPAIAAAQGTGTTTAAPKTFVPNYALVVLLCFLVLFSVCKPSHRNPEIKWRRD